MKVVTAPHIINSISDLHRLLELPKPLHPLISVIDLGSINCRLTNELKSFGYNFYSVCTKKDFNGKMKYGQNYYDFDEGILTLMAPGQIIATEVTENPSLSGYWLVFHADFIQQYSLATTIKRYGYFSYTAYEALHMSEQEERMIENTMLNIRQEYSSATDTSSHDVLIAHMELLLNYCNRFYNRQFITRKQASNDLLSRMEKLLSAYFDNTTTHNTLPTVQELASQLNVSPNYLSDMLRTLTGQSAQQHIHQALIEKAKALITTTSLSVSEIAYQLGFEYPQSFNKLFKSKTQLSPLEYRQSFN
ncbi:helix-turn-helix domain-containing protein [Mucilaginibacter koreensis]